MKNKERKGIGMLPIIVILILIVVIIIVTVIIFKNSKNNNGQNAVNGVANQTTTNNETEEFVSNLDDGTKLNNSSKLSETKTFDGMEISGIQITEKDGATLLLATVKNTSSSEKGNYPVALTILDKDGNTLTIAHGYIQKLAAGESTQLSISKTFDFANAYDFTIAKE